MPIDDYADHDGVGLAELVRSGEVTAGELAEEALSRIEKHNPTLNAVVTDMADQGRRIAGDIDEGDAAAPFAGVPFLLKDIMGDFEGVATQYGSRFTAGSPAPMHSTLTTRFLASGLVPLGKTNVPEFGLLPVSESALYGPARNPWNPDHTPGGSSGGSAAAVAAGIVPLAHANDGGGSIRIPASSCGLVGLKPSRARIPQGPLIGDAMSGLTSDLVVSRTVRDTAVALDIAAGPEPGDPYFAPHHDGIWSDDVGTAPGNLRIGFTTKTMGGVPVHDECADAVQNTAKLLESLGHHVEEGDKLGKTIIFAKNSKHAQFIAERFDANYPHLKGHFARVIDYSVEYAQSLIDDFSDPAKSPQIAISVDMLDTGIDVPEALNLVFFKIVRSKTKFWQMIGRGTRLCPDLFGPGMHKESFRVFDFCQNFEFFSQNPNLSDGVMGPSLGEKLFVARVDLMQGIGDLPQVKETPDQATPLVELRAALRGRLHDEVTGMRVDNFVVRPHRRSVEKFQSEGAWEELSREDRNELCEHVAGLPSALEDDELEARQFDFLVLQAQLSVLHEDSTLTGLQKRIIKVCSSLEELSNVPMVAAEMALILEVQTPDFWQDVTLPNLESMRKRLRKLVKLIEPASRKIVYTDFEDEIGEGAEIDLPDVGNGTDKAAFLQKVRRFLEQHEDHITLLKLKRNEQLTPSDLAELERIFLEEDIAADDDLERVREGGGLGVFIRSLVGLDRNAAKQALDQFTQGKGLTPNQLEFVDLIIDYLTERGVIDPRVLYESPFTDIDDQGVSGVFPAAEVKELVVVLNGLKERAVA